MYKICNVIMLPSKEKKELTIVLYPNIMRMISQHLYILSNEEITDNDWVLLPNNEIHKMSPTDMIHYLDSQSKTTKKIIATTNLSLGLPQPSQQFIEKYIEECNKDIKTLLNS